jgi:ubiquinone/menaquinone biosynthesis C-methylase UbiE
VGFYSQFIFPRLCDLVLGGPRVARHRRELLARAAGDVLEIGFGTGLNLPHYPPAVRRLTVIDPNVGMHRLARRRLAHVGIPVERHVLAGERLPFAADSFDCVVSTFTLCSITDVERALAEVYRVLKPGGRFLFLEHGLSPEPRVQVWQRRLNWLEQRLADGCRLDRGIRTLVAGPPFASLDVAEFYLERMPRTHGYLSRGVATK